MYGKTENQAFNSFQWQTIQTLGRRVDACLEREDVGLTLGGEPTFVAAGRPELPEWRTTPLGADKLRRARRLLLRLRNLWAPGSPIQFATGKSYPGEEQPRWSLVCFWRRDGRPLWSEESLLATPLEPSPGAPGKALRFLKELARQVRVDPECLLPFREEEGGITGYVLPLLRAGEKEPIWATCRWRGPWGDSIPLLPGPAPAGLRLPLDRLDSSPDKVLDEWLDQDDGLPLPFPSPAGKRHLDSPGPASTPAPVNSIRVALCAQAARDAVRVFLPPIGTAASHLDLLNRLEATARRTNLKVRLEGYPPPFDPRLLQLSITPDPGVLEVNLPPRDSWPDLVEATEVLFREASGCGLRPWKFFSDGRRTGSGGGTHFTLGGKRPDQSPWLMRPDLLRSFLAFWNNHPGLSHAFAGLFVGPTSQSPRLDQSRPHILPEADLALSRLQTGVSLPPDRIDALLRYFLTDLTGNAHRAEFCIDKLFPSGHPDRQWGLVEWRGAEMVPTARHWLVLVLLLRTLTLRFWREPYRESLIAWGESLYDRFALPFFMEEDLAGVAEDLERSDFPFKARWLASFLDFRYPVLGRLQVPGARVEIRQALEPWPVLGQEVAGGGPSRPVDCSCERLQILLEAKDPDRFQVACNGLLLPLEATGHKSRKILGLRFKAWDQANSLHPHLTPHPPLTLDLVDKARGALLARGRYHWLRPDGAPYADEPKNLAEGRRRFRERFQQMPPGKSSITSYRIPPSRAHTRTFTLDLLRVRAEDLEG